MQLKFIAFLFIASSLISCRSLTSSVMFETSCGYNFDQVENENKTIISPYDQLSVLMTTNAGHVLLENTFVTDKNSRISDNLNRHQITYMVGADSLVKLPTVGRIKLGGLSVLEAENLLEKEFSENYQNPFVKIEITNRKVILFLEESTEGHIVQLPEENMTLIEAIAASGGLTANSKSYQIKLIRNSTGAPKVFKYNFRNIEDFKEANMNLAANDIIYVESKPRYITKVLSEIQPYLVLISSAVLVYSIFSK